MVIHYIKSNAVLIFNIELKMSLQTEL